MTKLHSAAVHSCDKITPTPDMEQSDEVEAILTISLHNTPPDESLDSACDNGDESGGESVDSYDEPLGYENFLYHVNIEYSPGGNRSSPLGNKYCFKMKCLPYMLACNSNGPSHDCSIDGSSSDITSCDREESNGHNKFNSNQTVDLTNLTSMMRIDVTKETCAFLGNSDFVPSLKNKTRQVVLELVSAKLSQSSGYHIPPDSSLTNLASLGENRSINYSNRNTTTLSSQNSHTPIGTINQNSRSLTRHTKIAPHPSPASPSSSKKFVNYTILVKTLPGLDKQPAVIERRFSDFLNLYQGLNTEKKYANIVERYVTFPKKVYMGNFSLDKIAERSIEFSRLLDLCMLNIILVWSVPFISFLIDKELKEAHRLSLIGDPDDVQALIENAYYIEQKLYFGSQAQSRRFSSSCSLELSSGDSPTLPNRRSSTTLNQSRSNQTISFTENNSPSYTDADAHDKQKGYGESNGTSPHSSNSAHDSSGSEIMCVDKTNLASINQRILVTFCMLFVTYCRSQNHHGLKQAIGEFALLISSQDFVGSLIDTRHYSSLRACLLFLMNLDDRGVVDNNIRMLLKRKLEDIDGMQAEINDRTHAYMTNSSSSSRARRTSTRDDANNMSSNGASRVTKKDLTSLLRDGNFCSFQDGRLSR